MLRKFWILPLVVILCMNCSHNSEKEIVVTSPNGHIKVSFELIKGRPFYNASFNKISVIEKSSLGFRFKKQPDLAGGFEVVKTLRNSFDETWEQVWGEKRFIRNNYNELIVELKESEDLERKLTIAFRVFDDGIGFRYIIPEQENIDSLYIMDELTEFRLSDNHKAWWIPAYRDNRYEYLFKQTTINEIDTVHTPLTIETNDGLYLSIHEADLTNYASMTLANTDDSNLKCDLVPWMDGTKVKSRAPVTSPWRTIQIAESPGELITSYMVLNLNEPNILEDVSWIKPSKYMGIWWGMHIGKYTFWESETQGATTENAKMYIDFASENNIPLLLIEGWNKGWTPEWYMDALHEFSFTDCADGFDIMEVNNYAHSKGIELIGYHETGSNLTNYLNQIDTAFALYKKLGIHNVKIGQVGSRLNMKEWHHGQFGVKIYL